MFVMFVYWYGDMYGQYVKVHNIYSMYLEVYSSLWLYYAAFCVVTEEIKKRIQIILSFVIYK